LPAASRLNRGKQQFRPTLCAVRIARAQFGGQTIAFTIEQQQRIITGRREMPVVVTLLLAMDWDLHIVPDTWVTLSAKRG